MEIQIKKFLVYLILPLILLVVVVLIVGIQARHDFNLHAIFYDNFAMIKTYTDRKIIIDGGPDDTILSKIGNQLPFYDRTVDLLILTRVDSAHVSGLVDVLKRYTVKQVLIPASDANLAVYWEFLDLVKRNNVRKIFLNPGQRIWLDQATVFDIVSTDPFFAQLSFGKTHILFPYDQNHNLELISDGSRLVKK